MDSSGQSDRLMRGSMDDESERHHRAGQEHVYYRTNDTAVLGAPDINAAIGNPLKGLAGGALWDPTPLPDSVPLSIEFYNLGLDEIMVGDKNFDWTRLERLIAGSATRKMHAVLSVFIDWPGQPLRLPPHLLGIQLYPTDPGHMSPNYGDPLLLTALQQFITALGTKYDGDKRIAAIHLGLLGFWGEGHTFPYDLVPPQAKTKVATWYRSAFTKTKLQARYPGPDASGLGLYDGSFAYNTLDGEYNGGVVMSWFFEPQIRSAGQQDAWKQSMMGGETRPELQDTIFTSSYPAGTELHQDFRKCVEMTHVSYILHHDAFQNGGYTGDVLLRARAAHAYMGYSFHVSEVAASTSSTTGKVDIAVTVNQAGVAPFYYDLSLVLDCAGLPTPLKLSGVDQLVDRGQSKTFLFQGVPATCQCLGLISLQLESSYAYSGRPILFAQGTNGTVSLSRPLPPTAPTAPIPALTAPIPAPTAPKPVQGTFLLEARIAPDGSRFTIDAASGTTVFGTTSTVSGTVDYDGGLFRYHRWGSVSFTYTIVGFAPGSLQAVTLGFAETYQPNFVKGKRVFNILAKGVTVKSNVDVFNLAGCNKGYITTETVAADSSGNIVLKFVGVKDNPFVSFVEIKPK